MTRLLATVLAMALTGCGGAAEERRAPAAAPAIAVRPMAGENLHALVLPAGATRDAALAAARAACGTGGFCQVRGWFDAALVPGGLPMSDAETTAMAFQFNLNRATDYQAIFLDCARFEEQPGDQCLGR